MEQERAKQIQTMFSRITGRYDLMNKVMTGGQDQAWRRIAAKDLQLQPNGLVLDLATGTADLAIAVREAYPDSRVIAADFSETILRAGAAKVKDRNLAGIEFAVGDALSLSFPDHTFDGITNAFLLRNAVDLPRCLREMRRVTKPGGRVVCMEITHPQTPVFKQAFGLYFNKMVPVIGGVISGDYKAYKYLPVSLSKFPPAAPLKNMMMDAGYRDVTYRLLALGTMAIHTGVA
jgi:demethylmenaquinone methyltransferase/2-methoxy-6-polyprenyl-1,4-benzoquinol methylase